MTRAMRLVGFLHFAILALVLSSPLTAGSSNVVLETSGTPDGFAELAGEREVLVDVYFGGQKVGEALARTSPGALQFRAPGEVASMLPLLISAAAVNEALGSRLPTHGELVCSSGTADRCGVLAPDIVGIIYDEDRFRVDLFVNPSFLRTSGLAVRTFLPPPTAPLGLTSSVGAALSGSSGGPNSYTIQNRTVVGWRNARLRMNSALASKLGWIIDDLAGELEHKDLRYSAGLFWAPGNDFIGQRRLVGAGVATQFDTWADRNELHGTPLVLFLAQPARVDLVVDGRLVSSRSYPAGSVALDTAALPNGSFNVLVRIHQANGTVSEEQRFFARNLQAPPMGHPSFHAFAGMLANTRRHDPISLSGTFFYDVGGAWRLDRHFAFDIAATGTQHKALFETGAWLLARAARVRVAALVSTAGDAGALLQLSSGGQGPVNFSLDLRRIWSSDGKPLIPLPSYVDSFGATPPTGLQLASGSYTQATGSVGVRLASGTLAIVGSYRKDESQPADYSIGPSINLPVLTRGAVQLVLDASAQRTRTTMAAFAGMRLLFTSGGFSVLGRLGHGSHADDADPRSFQSRVVGSVSAQYSHEDADRTLVELEAGADRDIAASTAHAGGALYSRFGNARVDLLHNLEEGGTQYGLTLQSGVALTRGGLAIAGRDLDQSALIVSVTGDAAAAEFNVLVDGVVRGRVKSGHRLSIFMPGYRSYKVRLVAAAASAVDYDGSAREVTLYPGNVQRLSWNVKSYFTIFARATSADGRPIANALVRTASAVGESDANGNFQIDMRAGEPITMATGASSSCTVKLPRIVVKDDFASVGKVLCQ